MNREEYDRMYLLEGSYWWFQGRLQIIRSILEQFLPEQPRIGRVLDVGCGTGLMLDEFARWKLIGLDFSPHALRYCRARGRERLVRGDVTRLPFEDNSIDLILALDLMEHVERDDLMIEEFHRVLRPGGCIMATVPAHPSLWSEHDVALHHFRRYTPATFHALLERGRLTPIKFSYAISFTYLPIIAFRTGQKIMRRLFPRPAGSEARAHLVLLPGLANSALKKLLDIEASLLRRMNLPFGVSLLTLSRKMPADSD